MTTLPVSEYIAPAADARYPGYAATLRHAVDGYGLQRLCKDNRCIVTAMGPDVALIELLVGIAGSSLLLLASWHEVGWFFAEREGDRWEFSLEAGGHFDISHASLVRVCSVIDALLEGRIPDVGEALNADQWDLRYGWAHESGLLDSRLEALDTLAIRYVVRLNQEGIVPGRSASPEVEAARTELLAALAAEGILNRAQPDAIFYQLRDGNCTYLREVVDALDMSFHLSEICGEVLPEPGTDVWRIELFAERPAIPGTHRVALDWWIIEPDYPSDGMLGTVNFAHYCNQALERAHVVDLEPVPMEFMGRRLYLIVGRYQGRVELRGVLPEGTLVGYDCSDRV